MFEDFTRRSKAVINGLVSWLIVIALAVNVSVASINIINSFFSNNELTQAGKFLDSVESRVNENGFVFYETANHRIVVTTKEWYENNHRNQEND
ncbi:hypothetical protein A9G35_03870 [Gilliamella sp. Choc5-1]|jgi:hypothetical protein|uniref:hypothetical protein n=1 Tax=Gilliamella sp. Choc5-1 TaxID=3120238 RepID=UPI00080D9B0D|nr:hypothetical protein [Gilliamella apicola]OCG47488.1 hypothetical protein A9G35_03870 [Gilliamella apicola]